MRIAAIILTIPCSKTWTATPLRLPLDSSWMWRCTACTGPTTDRSAFPVALGCVAAAVPAFHRAPPRCCSSLLRLPKKYPAAEVKKERNRRWTSAENSTALLPSAKEAVPRQPQESAVTIFFPSFLFSLSFFFFFFSPHHRPSPGRVDRTGFKDKRGSQQLP